MTSSGYVFHMPMLESHAYIITCMKTKCHVLTLCVILILSKFSSGSIWSTELV